MGILIIITSLLFNPSVFAQWKFEDKPMSQDMVEHQSKIPEIDKQIQASEKHLPDIFYFESIYRKCNFFEGKVYSEEQDFGGIKNAVFHSTTKLKYVNSSGNTVAYSEGMMMSITGTKITDENGNLLATIKLENVPATDGYMSIYKIYDKNNNKIAETKNGKEDIYDNDETKIAEIGIKIVKGLFHDDYRWRTKILNQSSLDKKIILMFMAHMDFESYAGRY